MNTADQEMLSDESEDDGAGESCEEVTYRRKYQMLLERCEVLQQDNERLVHRIQQVFKYTRQVRKERKYLMDRLDNYGDNWRQGITQYFYDNNIQSNKSSTKAKHNSHSNEKHNKRSSSSSKRSSKEKIEGDSNRKNMKESGSKNISKSLSSYNFL